MIQRDRSRRTERTRSLKVRSDRICDFIRAMHLELLAVQQTFASFRRLVSVQPSGAIRWIGKSAKRRRRRGCARLAQVRRGIETARVRLAKGRRRGRVRRLTAPKSPVIKQALARNLMPRGPSSVLGSRNLAHRHRLLGSLMLLEFAASRQVCPI